MSTTADLTGLGMPPALAERLGNTPASVSGAGTTQGTATTLRGSLFLATPTASNTGFILSNLISTGRPVRVFNRSATVAAIVYPPSGGAINGGSANAGVTIPPNGMGEFNLLNGNGVAAEAWGAAITSAGGSGVGSAVPQQVYNAVSTAPTANDLAIPAASITGASTKVFLNLTATLGAGATLTLPTVAALVTAIQAAGMSVVAGASYEIDVINFSSANFAWTVTTNTGWTLTGTMTAAQNTIRRGIITFTSLTAATFQSVGGYAVTAI